MQMVSDKCHEKQMCVPNSALSCFGDSAHFFSSTLSEFRRFLIGVEISGKYQALFLFSTSFGNCNNTATRNVPRREPFLVILTWILNLLMLQIFFNYYLPNYSLKPKWTIIRPGRLVYVQVARSP